MSEARVDALRGAERPDAGGDLPAVAADDAAAAMGEDRACHAFRAAPRKLRGNGRMADQCMVPLADHGAHDGRAVSHIEIDAAQRGVLILESRRGPERRRRWRDPPSPGSRQPARARNGPPGRPRSARHRRGTARADDHAAILKRIVVDESPGLRGGVDGTGRAFRQPEGVIAVAVGEDDGRGRDFSERLQPIGAAIDHDARRPARHEQSRVAAVTARPQRDLAACAKERELDVSALLDLEFNLSERN